jgi:hypothetical protein
MNRSWDKGGLGWHRRLQRCVRKQGWQKIVHQGLPVYGAFQPGKTGCTPGQNPEAVGRCQSKATGKREF